MDSETSCRASCRPYRWVSACTSMTAMSVSGDEGAGAEGGRCLDVRGEDGSWGAPAAAGAPGWNSSLQRSRTASSSSCCASPRRAASTTRRSSSWESSCSRSSGVVRQLAETTVPTPGRTSSRPMRVSSATTLWAVLGLILSAWLSSRTDGKGAPAVSSPDTTARVAAKTIWRKGESPLVRVTRNGSMGVLCVLVHLMSSGVLGRVWCSERGGWAGARSVPGYETVACRKAERPGAGRPEGRIRGAKQGGRAGGGAGRPARPRARTGGYRESRRS